MAEALLLGCKKRNAALLSILVGLIGCAYHGLFFLFFFTFVFS